MILFQAVEGKPGEKVKKLATALDEVNAQLRRTLVGALEKMVPGFEKLNPYQKEVATNYVLAKVASDGTEKNARKICGEAVVDSINTSYLQKQLRMGFK